MITLVSTLLGLGRTLMHRTVTRDIRICKTVPHIYFFLISGNEGAISENGSEVFTAFDKSIFEEAKKLGINRTVHAGEDGPSENVRIAVEEMFAQRIGHGYRVMQDKELYQKCRYEFQFLKGWLKSWYIQ